MFNNFTTDDECQLVTSVYSTELTSISQIKRRLKTVTSAETVN